MYASDSFPPQEETMCSQIVLSRFGTNNSRTPVVTGFLLWAGPVVVSVWSMPLPEDAMSIFNHGPPNIQR
tara:strand:- start:2129 stop:2338 length:210 start_codon:yes stop_codon:yes gene_type:complete